MHKFVKILTLILFVLSLIYATIAVMNGAGYGVGTYFPALLTGSLTLVAYLWKKPKGKHRKRLKPLMFAYFAGLALYIATFAIFIVSVAVYSADELDDYPSAVIVLGCKKFGDVPGQSMKTRCDKAIEVLEQYPNAICIAAGGLDAGSEYSEAYVIGSYLEQNGIDPSRIYLEENSTSTEENLRFSAELAEEKELDFSSAVLVTNEFHAPRAVLIAASKDITVTSASAPSPAGLIVPNFIREYFALIKTILFDI